MGFFGKILDAFTGGVGSAVSTAIGGAVGQALPLSKAEKQQNAFNAEQAKINRDWQAEMSNTAYQRGVADMSEAGLNPQMMYGGVSSGASTPSGATASSGGFSNRALQGAQVALEMQRSYAELRKLKAEAKLTEITAEYAPEKFNAEIDGLIAGAKSDEAKAHLTELQSTYQSVQNDFERDILTTSLRLSRGQIKLNDAQSRNVAMSSGLIQLKYITESKTWEQIDAQTKELLTRAGLNKENYEVAKAQVQKIWSDISVNDTIKTKNKEESALTIARKIGQNIDNAERVDPNDMSDKGKKTYQWFNKTLEVLGQVTGMVPSMKFNKTIKNYNMY